MAAAEELEKRINEAWERRTELSAATKGETREAVDEALALLDGGKARVAEPEDGGNVKRWRVNQWLKKAVLLSFRLNDNAIIGDAPNQHWDKVPLKFGDWSEEEFRKAGFRAVPGAVARRGVRDGAARSTPSCMAAFLRKGSERWPNRLSKE